MTTATTSTVIDHSSDLGFGTWAFEMKTQLSAVGMVQTSDTGQITNTGAALTPRTGNTALGYEIWRTTNSTLYYKLEYGTGSSTSTPQMWITIGTGSNGSGTITGQTNTRNIITCNNVPTSTATAYTSYFASGNSYLNIVWKALGFNSSTHGGMLISGTTCNSSGTPTTTGFAIFRAQSIVLWGFQSVRTASIPLTGTDMTSTSNFGTTGVGGYGVSIVPGSVTSSLDNSGANQAYPWWMNVRDVLPFKWACTVVSAEATIGTQFTATMIGTNNNYIAIPSGTTTGNQTAQTKVANYQSTGATGDNTYTIAMLYE